MRAPLRICCRLVVIFLLAFIYGLSITAQAGDQPVYPARLGIDNAGSDLLTRFQKEEWKHPLFFKALEELGAKVLCYHIFPVSNAGQDSSRLTGERLLEIDAAMRRHGLEWLMNIEIPNFAERLEITPGVNEFEHPGGIHRWDLRMEWLDPLLPPNLSGKPALLSIVYDECEHMILSNNKFSNIPRNDFDAPFLVNTHGMPLTEAYEKLAEKCLDLRTGHYQSRIALQSEQVWPDLFHIFARAGWIIAPKLLKEGLSSVVLSNALGAALQYQDSGTALWASPDLWRFDSYPGHSPEELRSALLMGYWLGAETLYVENLDYHGPEKRNPKADPEGSLIAWSDPDHYTVTAHGRVVQDFFKTYVPAHPRAITWRDYDPKVAIIRLPDGGWGQFSAGPGHGEAASRNRLLGNREMPLDEAASEWLKVWSILTHGASRPGAISINNPFVYPEVKVDCLIPIDSVAVFDHLVGYEPLRNVDALIVCGHALSEAAYQAICRRVSEGASCIISRRLLNLHAMQPTEGDWLVVDDFTDARIAEKLGRHLGPSDTARFRFKHHVVDFTKLTSGDDIEVKVTERDGNPSGAQP